MPGWALAVALVMAGETERGLAAMRALGGDEIEYAVPVERCFDWEGFALGELAAGNVEAAEGFATRAEELAAGLDLQLPAGLAARTRAAILLAAGQGGRGGREGARRRRRLHGGRRPPAGGVRAQPARRRARRGR